MAEASFLNLVVGHANVRLAAEHPGLFMAAFVVGAVGGLLFLIIKTLKRR
jgi:hypothetical protein